MADKKRRPGPYAIPERKAYPIGDVAHANFAITRLYMSTVTDEDRKKVIKAIKKRYPKNTSLKMRIDKLEKAKKLKKKSKKRKVKKKTAKKAPAKKAKKVAKKKKTTKRKKKTTKKGNRRKGQPRGARLAYDDLKKKKKKKRSRKTGGGLLDMLTSELHNF